MRIRYRVAIAVALLALISAGAVLLLLRPLPPEPSYDGKPLSYWLNEGYRAFDEPLANPAQMREQQVAYMRAMSNFGSNALPALSRMLHTRDSDFKLKLMQLADRQHVVNFHFVPAYQLNLEAINALGRMGGGHNVFAVPLLAEVYARNVILISNHPPKPNPGAPTIQKFMLTADPAEMILDSIPHILGNIGPAASNAVPALALGLSCTNSDFRQLAVVALGKIHSRPDIAVPALIQGIRDPDPYVRSSSLDSLQQFGGNAAPALPIIFALLQDPDVEVQKAALRAIFNLKLPDYPAIAVPALTRVLASTDSYQTYEALNTLKIYGPDAKPAVPAILDLLHRRESTLGRPDLSLREDIKSALDQIDPAAARAAGL